jgi:hypothetical protein
MQGEDWVPENHHFFGKRDPWGPKLELADKSIQGAICEIELDDGSFFTSARIGPIYTTGGYDWVQVGWEDAWDLEDKIKKHPAGILVQAQVSGAVDKDGKRIGHPPIHVHHIHIGNN